MPGYGKNLKRKGPKVVRRAKDQRASRIQGNNVVQKAWKKGTLKKNYEKFGLATDANAAVETGAVFTEPAEGARYAKRKREAEKAAKAANETSAKKQKPASATEAKNEKVAADASEPRVADILQKTVDDKGIDQDTALSHRGLTERRRPAHWMSEEDCLFIAPLVDKYGTDYKAMCRDIKLNIYQHPMGHLRRKAQRFVKFRETGLSPV
ncbi:Nucleolar protein 16 [Hondaea fermentalgiana]|uniref:Nucleolar protein 16 n=1 Tax=Hondaea fermentalgiana TaxID=2315210 RepID=A0A2R5GJV0_9STRA|nr:Nucleolar protein 16 [Hondaea fermentalgiana]|eukprot:GBG30599.1 Nucleolar protein 16 [Hondaea fermentalgiana]